MINHYVANAEPLSASKCYTPVVFEEMLAPEERSPYRLNPSPLRKTEARSLFASPSVTCEAPSAQIRNIVRSMEEDEHLAWLARMGPAPRPFTLEETLQEQGRSLTSRKQIKVRVRFIFRSRISI